MLKFIRRKDVIRYADRHDIKVTKENREILEDKIITRAKKDLARLFEKML